MKKYYEVLEHKADLKIKVYGSTKKELFKNAALAMTELMKAVWLTKEKSAKRKTKKRKARISSLDISALLVDFLGEVLYLSQTYREVYPKINFNNFSEYSLEALLFGKEVVGFNEDIKAVTHHDAKVYKNKKGLWEAVLLFDI